MPTVGLDFYSEDFNIKNKKIRVQIWDTAGQEKFRAPAKAYYRSANTILLVYDISNRVTFEKSKDWLQNIRMTAMQSVKILLIGNKNDLKEQRQVSEEEGFTFAKENNLYFKETSCKDNQNQCVQQAFWSILEETVQFMITQQDQEQAELQQKIR